MPVPNHIDHRVRGEGTDFVLTEVTDTLRKMKSQSSLNAYLEVLLSLKPSPYLATARKVTRLRLQAELYSLTSSGGPRYLSRDVNQAAFNALDSLFPYGRRSRRLVNIAFKFLHPTEGWWVIRNAFWSGIAAFKGWVDRSTRSLLTAANKCNPFCALTKRYKRH